MTAGVWYADAELDILCLGFGLKKGNPSNLKFAHNPHNSPDQSSSFLRGSAASREIFSGVEATSWSSTAIFLFLAKTLCRKGFAAGICQVTILRIHQINIRA